MTAHKESGFRFDYLWLRELHFEDSGNSEPLKERELGMEFSVRVATAEDLSVANVGVSVEVKPNAANDFKLLRATIEGQFTALSVEDRPKLREFAERQASALIVPFLRELIANITTRARGGGVLIPPINLLRVDSEAKAATK